MNSNANWVLQVDDSVCKFLSKIPRQDSERVLRAIQELPQDPFHGDIQKMRGEINVWRRRIGVFRFRYELIQAGRIIHVFLAERRVSKSY